MRSLDELRALVRDHHKRVDASLLIQAEIQDSSDLDANQVRVYRLDIRKNVIINGFHYAAGMVAWCKELPNKELQIVYIDVAASAQVFGAGTAARTLPPAAGGETVAWSIPPLGLTEGRLETSTLGGLYVHTGAFTFQGRVHLGGTLDGAGNFDATAYDESVAAYVPGTADTARWVGRYWKATDATFHFVAGALESWPTVAYLNEETLGDLVCPAGCYPLGAVALAYGQTTVTGGRFASWRNFVTPQMEIVTNADFDARLLALLEEGAKLTRLSVMGTPGGRPKSAVVRTLLRWPYGAKR